MLATYAELHQDHREKRNTWSSQTSSDWLPATIQETHKWNVRETNDEEVDQIMMEMKQEKGGGRKRKQMEVERSDSWGAKPPREAGSIKEEQNV